MTVESVHKEKIAELPKAEEHLTKTGNPETDRPGTFGGKNGISGKEAAQKSFFITDFTD